MGHLKMLGAVQPFLSGGASKTINLPNDATVEDIEKIYLEAWQLGIKSVALYRDGCKASQPFETGKGKHGAPAAPRTRRGSAFPTSGRRSRTTSRSAATTATSRSGSTPTAGPARSSSGSRRKARRSTGSWIRSGSRCRWRSSTECRSKDLVRKLAHLRFEPAGATNNPKIRFAKSIPDYVARWLAIEFLTEDERRAIGLEGPADENGNGHAAAATPKTLAGSQTVKFETKALDSFSGDESGRGGVSEDSPSCHICGGIMVRSGTCYACTVCGATSGCS